MAAIHDLIAHIGDARLRERLTAEWAKATLPQPKARPRKGDLVCPRSSTHCSKE